eukprot:2222110-Prymnesium_polylepis.1
MSPAPAGSRKARSGGQTVRSTPAKRCRSQSVPSQLSRARTAQVDALARQAIASALKREISGPHRG